MSQINRAEPSQNAFRLSAISRLPVLLRDPMSVFSALCPVSVALCPGRHRDTAVLGSLPPGGPGVFFKLPTHSAPSIQCFLDLGQGVNGGSPTPVVRPQVVCYLRGRRVTAAPPCPRELHPSLCVHSGDDRTAAGALLTVTSPPAE